MNYSNVKRINVVGVSGSGKSTISRKLSEKLSIPYIEMDKVFWGPNWYLASDDEFFDNLKKEIDGDEWILDGNYTRTIPIKWERVQMVIWVDLPFRTTLYQALKRAIKRSVSREELWEGTGNKESFRRSFFSKNSIILWTIRSYKTMKNRYEALIRNEDYCHIKFVRLSSHKEIDKFIGEFR